jgi:endonuclease/exonuclease/phosphatase family metal-dependent hydrolase
MFKRLMVVLVAVALLGIGPSNANAQNRDRVSVVMTRNMDTGSDFGFVVSAKTPLDLVLSVTATYQEIQASNIPERAAGIAREIQATRPYLVGLQEVTTVRTGPFGGPATTVVADGLMSLLASLAQRGLHYKPVAIQMNADVEAPAFDQSFSLFDVRVTDFDVMLARTDLPVSEFKLEAVQQQHFIAMLVFPTPTGQSIPFPRGWIAVDTKLRGKSYRVLNTHLETFNLDLQAAQAIELVNGPAISDMPVILVGDLNSDADNPDPALSPAYRILVNAGFLDIWSTIHPGDPGLTWPLHGEDPFTPSSSPNQRIDLIFAQGSGIEARDIALTGNSLSDLTPSGLWPSDHAGVIASFNLLP